MTPPKKSNSLRGVYDKLYSYFGPQYWWPARSPFEVVIGAILTQNTNWSNVEKAISELKKNKLLNPAGLRAVGVKKLARIIKSSGYYNLKAARLKSFVDYLFNNFNGRLPVMFSLQAKHLREALLKIKGVGPETADSILLYAAEKPVFVVDAYTKRFLARHGFIRPETEYQQVQNLFTNNLPRSVKLFNEYHALIVRLAKDFCRKKPMCGLCPLKEVECRNEENTSA